MKHDCRKNENEEQEQYKEDMKAFDRLTNKWAISFVEDLLKKGEVEAIATVSVTVKVHLAVPSKETAP